MGTVAVLKTPERAPSLWFVTVTVAGAAMPAGEVKAALQRLCQDRPFMSAARYSSERIELQYWDEAESFDTILFQARVLWADHRESAKLPDWKVVGIEVIDRETARSRWRVSARPSVRALGDIVPMEDTL